MATRRGRAPFVGCSGWQYPSWRKAFYPAGLPSSQWLTYYASQFNTLEVNNSFYRLPQASTFAAWRAATPAGFVVSVKASRYLTHLKRLRDPEAPLALFFSRAIALGPRLGPVLYQLPPTLSFDADRLRLFLDALPRTTRAVSPADGPRHVRGRRIRHVIEFRHASWYRDDVFAWLEEADVSFCLHDMKGSSHTEISSRGVVYVRFHGTEGKYRGSYGDEVLERWGDRLTESLRRGQDVYAYFNNDLDGTAVANARTLRAAIGF
jgi:uncharacterized protein YecE (DUF72 family)